MEKKQMVLLDTDIGGDIDDAVCLAYLLQEPRCRLMGVTTVCGEAEKRAAVADALCRAAGKNIPIVAGMDTPLQPIPAYPTPEGAGALARWEHGQYAKGDAPGFLYQIIRAHPLEVILIAIGNMTNVASLFRRYPDAPALLKGLFVMNGYFGAQPLPQPWYNWNAWADPLASHIVFAAHTAVHRAVPIEITGQLTLKPEQAQTLLPQTSRLARAVLDFGSAWLQSAQVLTLHDPLAAVCAFYPEVCRFERGFVTVETQQEQTMGATVFQPDPAGNVEIARWVDREGFYRILRQTLAG
ncbi:MAG TPA: nucleoside hydrolase [Candidatus Gallacutalibacter stercoravium]|nr:nucleoside hydrolase [Candidatus Gallacutalibacter stercoravium]